MNSLLKMLSCAASVAAWIGTAVLILTVGLTAQSSQAATPALQGQPHLFAPGVVSTPDFEFNAAFTPDGNTVYFSKADPGFTRITIVVSHLKDGAWGQPEVAPFSGLWKDVDPIVSPDGKRLFFTSNRPIDGSNAPRKDYDIWFVERSANGEWGEAQHVKGPVNSDGNESHASVTRDGTMYFEASRPDHPGIHVYRSRLVNTEYAAPELLGFAGQGNDLNPVVASDESFLIFASRDSGGLGAGDLYVSFHRPDGSWSAPKNLGAPINSAFQEIAPSLSPDNQKLYFASSRIDGPATRTSRVNYQQLEGELHAIQNGLLNVYEVDIGDLRHLDAP